MTFNKLKEILERNNIPNNVKLMSDSGWECSATEMDALYYDRENNVVVFCQYFSEWERDYVLPKWEKLQ